MAKADTSVKWFHSGMTDAPVLSGQVGKLIELLDACLINGFSTRTPDSIVVSGGVATVSISAGNPYEKHAVITISGASVALLNSEWRIDSSSASSFTFLCPGVADGTVTGASVTRASAAWEKPFVDTNVAVYRSSDLTSTRLLLRVDDANARYGRVRGYEEMNDANTGLRPFPLLTQIAEANGVWAKSTSASSTVRNWVLVADGSFFHVFLSLEGNDNRHAWHRFGDLVSFVGVDVSHCMLCSFNASSPASAFDAGGSVLFTNSNGYSYLARNSEQTVGAIAAAECGSVLSSSSGASLSTLPVGDYLLHHPILVKDGYVTTEKVRGILPGVRQILNNKTEANKTIIEFQDGESNGVSILVGVVMASTNQDGQLAVDIVGPWR